MRRTIAADIDDARISSLSGSETQGLGGLTERDTLTRHAETKTRSSKLGKIKKRTTHANTYHRKQLAEKKLSFQEAAARPQLRPESRSSMRCCNRPQAGERMQVSVNEIGAG